MSYYDEPEEEFIMDPDDRLFDGEKPDLTLKKELFDIEELKTIQGVSPATCYEFDANVFAQEYGSLISAISANRRIDISNSRIDWLAGSYGYGERVVPMLLHRDTSCGGIVPAHQQRIEWLAAYLHTIARLDVRIMDLWEIIEVCDTGSISDKADLLEWSANKNKAIIFNDAFLHTDPPWGGAPVLKAKVHTLFRALYAKGGNIFVVVDHPSSTELQEWWGPSIANFMLKDFVASPF